MSLPDYKFAPSIVKSSRRNAFPRENIAGAIPASVGEGIVPLIDVRVAACDVPMQTLAASNQYQEL